MIYKIYKGNKTYMFPSMEIATPEVIEDKFPAILMFPHIIGTDENDQVIFSVENLSAARTEHKIPAEMTDEEAVEIGRAHV